MAESKMTTGPHYVPALDDAVTLHLRATGKSQGKLAEEMGMAENSFSWKRRGVREFTLAEAARLADIVGFDLDAVLGRA